MNIWPCRTPCNDPMVQCAQCGNWYYAWSWHQCPVYGTYPMFKKETSGTWEKCPVCDGTGFDPKGVPQGITNEPPPACPCCNGKRIISSLTGNPPA